MLDIEHDDLLDYGFDEEDTLETEDHLVTYVFYDIGRLMIKSKPKHGGDDIYIEDYFTKEKFEKLIFLITGHRLENKNEVYIIESTEEGRPKPAYWKKNSLGYVQNVEEAKEFTKAEAEEITNQPCTNKIMHKKSDLI